MQVTRRVLDLIDERIGGGEYGPYAVLVPATDEGLLALLKEEYTIGGGKKTGRTLKQRLLRIERIKQISVSEAVEELEVRQL